MIDISTPVGSESPTVKTITGQTVEYNKAVCFVMRQYGVGWSHYYILKGSSVKQHEELRYIKIEDDWRLCSEQEVYWCSAEGKYKIVNHLTCVDAHNPERLFEFNLFAHMALPIVDSATGNVVQGYYATLMEPSESPDIVSQTPQDLVAIKLPFSLYKGSVRASKGIVANEIVHNHLSRLNLSYKADSNNPHTRAINSLYQKSTHAIEPHHELQAKIFSGTTFGIEYETLSSELRPFTIGALGLIPLKDGSISGIEYASVKLTGPKGFASVENQCQFLSTTNRVSSSCSLHVHGSVLNPSKELIVALYLLYYRVQPEIMGMMPYYVKHPIQSGKSRNYAEALNIYNMADTIKKSELDDQKSYDELIETLFAFVYNLYIGREYNQHHNENLLRTKKINLDWGSRSWHSATRYSQLNLVNMIAKVSGAAEFRIHPGTLSYAKVAPWLSICLALLKTAQNSAPYILRSFILKEKITVMDVVSSIPKDFKIDGPYVHAPDSKVGIFASNLLSYIQEWTTFRAEQTVVALRQVTKADSGTSGLVRTHLAAFEKELTVEETLHCGLFTDIIDPSRLLKNEEEKSEDKKQEKAINVKGVPDGPRNRRRVPPYLRDMVTDPFAGLRNI